MAAAQVIRPGPLIYTSSCPSRWSNVYDNDWLLPTPRVRSFRRMLSLNDLSSELLALVFEQLRDVDARSLAKARLLSHRFHDIITPILYETLRLNERIVDYGAHSLFPCAFEHIYAYTRHVEARSDLNPEGIKRIISKIRRLSSVRWRYTRAEFQTGSFWMPGDVLGHQHSDAGRTKLLVEELPLRDYAGDLHDSYLAAIPTDMLVSLKMAGSTPPLTTRLTSLKRLLLQARGLETFHYQDRGQGTCFAFVGAERLPAFKELCLRSYDWHHSADDVAHHWDFSQIRRLQLLDVPLYNFLISVPFHQLRDLESLHCEDFSGHLHDQRSEATQGLYILTKYIKALVSLNITCHTALFPIDGILQHASTLEELHFRDYVGFSEEDRRCPTMKVEDLAVLCSQLKSLRSLELDMDVALTDATRFLRILGSFPRLEALTLHVQTLLRPLDETSSVIDRDYEAAVTAFGTLVGGKAGVGWKCITINVGGWRRVMVRRISDAWRRQNERGVCAERCFVLERTHGDLLLREEEALER